MADTTPSEDHFWAAVGSNDVATAAEFLEKDASFAARDFRSPEKQKEDPWDNRFPLIKASQEGHFEMVGLLLEHGADIDAKSPTEERRHLGMPLLNAVERGHYKVAHLLLDRGADLGAHGYCSSSVVEELYEAAREAGAPQEMVRKGFERYLGPVALTPVSAGDPDVVRLFHRALSLGGLPSLFSIVHDGYYELVEELFCRCPEEPGTASDHPQGNVFVNLCNAGSWGGFPKVFELAMKCCPQLHTADLARTAIRRALVSHNRSGSTKDYEELVETQLRFLKDQDALEAMIEDGSLNPHYLLTKDYLWKGWTGPDSSPSTVKSMIGLAEIFVKYGFTDLSRPDPETGLTPLEQALERKEHPGLAQYAEFLIEHGASRG